MLLAVPLMKTPNHRTLVGADRREKMRTRLIESALLVFARRGADGTVIDEVIRTAEVARGTFYNYFKTNEELLTAVAEEVGNQMLEIVDPVVSRQPDPAARLAFGVRLMLMVGRAHPHLAAFLSRVGPVALGADSAAMKYLPRDLAEGMAAGKFTKLHPRLAFDLVAGPVLAGFHSLTHERVPKTYPQEMTQAILQSLGVPKASARKLAWLPLQELVLPAESLLMRAQSRALGVAPATS